MMNGRTLEESFAKIYPHAFFLDINKLGAFNRYLADVAFLHAAEQVTRMEKAGDSHMNLVLRVYTNERSFIVKQSRPWIEADPHKPAPDNRNIMEGEYYQLIANHFYLKSYHPSLLFFDESSHLLILEDLGNVPDFKFIYQKGMGLSKADVGFLAKFLEVLHNNFSADTVYVRLLNRDIRKRNFESFFVNPFAQRNVIPHRLTENGVQEILDPFLKDKYLHDAIRYLGRLYESDGTHLLHGDFVPENWLRTGNGIKIIDPEFCFFGPVEFDMGVLLGHLLLAQQPADIIKETITEFKRREDFDFKLLTGFAGVEIFKHLLTETHLPLQLNLQERKGLLEEARKLILRNEETKTWNMFTATSLFW